MSETETYSINPNSEGKHAASPQPKRGNKVFWILLLMCAFPYVIGTLYFQFRDYLPMPSSTNEGDLISPVRLVGDIPLQSLQGESFSTTDFLGQWFFVSVGSSACAEQCQKNIYHMRQVRKAMGDQQRRVGRLFVLSDTVQLASFKGMLRGYEDMVVAVGPKEAVQQWQTLLKDPNPSAEDGIYIVDPMGNVMMSYPPGFDAELIIKDLRRLLEVSQVG